MPNLGPIPPGAAPSNPNFPGQRLNPTSANAKFAAVEDWEGGPAIWTDYMIHNRYEWDGHIYANGVTQPTPFRGRSVAVVQLAAPTLILVSDWTAARFGKKPTAPDPTAPRGWTLLDVFPETVPAHPAPDGDTPLYRISGIYVYSCDNPDADIMHNVSFPRIPYLQDSFSRRVEGTDLATGIIFSNTQSVLRSPGR